MVYAIGIISALVTFWQSGRTTLYGDFAYFIENSYRIFIGQIPYKDFVLVLTPGTYYISALIMKVFGSVYIYQVFYSMSVSFLTVVITYKVLSLVGKNRLVNLLVLLPLVFSGHARYPFPSYDVNMMLVSLFGIYILLKTMGKSAGSKNYFFIGILSAVTILFKQNTGLIYTVLMFFLGGFNIYFFETEGKVKRLLLLMGGMLTILFVFLGNLLLTNSLREFVYQTLTFPITVRRPGSVFFATFADVFRPRSLFYYFPFLVISLLILVKKATNTKIFLLAIYGAVISPIVYASFLFVRNRGISTDMSFIPGFVYMFSTSVWYVVIFGLVFLLLFSLSTKKIESKTDWFMFVFSWCVIVFSLSPFMLHPIEAATMYSYPLFAVLLILLYNRLCKFFPSFAWGKVVGSIAGGTAIALCFSLIESHLLLIGVPLGVVSKQSITARSVRVTSYPGVVPETWEADVAAMLRYVKKNIPLKDSVVALPGIDPFYFVTGRIPPLAYTQYAEQTFPYSPLDYSAEIETHNVKWVIVKTDYLHTTEKGYMDVDAIVSALKNHYFLKKQIKGYNIYHRINN
ncbi:MAG: hypothetical protein WC775_01110 [Patescibacteria group bacterium]|jgi:hypothetical protein